MGQIELSGTVKFGACQLPLEVTRGQHNHVYSRCNLLVEVAILFVTEFEKINTALQLLKNGNYKISNDSYTFLVKFYFL